MATPAGYGPAAAADPFGGYGPNVAADPFSGINPTNQPSYTDPNSPEALAAAYGPAPGDPNSPLPPVTAPQDPTTGTYPDLSGQNVTGPSPDPTGGAGGVPSWLSNLIPSGSTLASAAPYGAAAAAALAAANAQKNQNASMTGQLSGAGAPLIAAGQQQLSEAQAGTLNPQEQGKQTTQFNAGAALTGEAGPLLSIGQTAFTQYVNGALPPWQQTELDNQLAAAKQEVRQSLGANVDSSTLSSYDMKLSQQYDTAKGQALIQNLQIGENAYLQGTNLQNLGFTDIINGWQTGIDAIQQSFTNAINLSTAGFGPLEAAIQLAVSSNTELTSALASMFGTLGMAYATQNAGKSGGGTTINNTTGGGGGGNPGLIRPSAGGGSSSTGGSTDTSAPGAPPTDTGTGLTDASGTGNPWTDPSFNLPTYDNYDTGGGG